MWFDQLSLKVLLALSSFFGVVDLPADLRGWQVVERWESYENGHRLVAEATTIVSACRDNPNAEIFFPNIVHGSQRVEVNDVALVEYGNSRFFPAAPFFGAPELSCRRLLESVKVGGENVVRWTVWSYSQYFARFYEFPSVRSGKSFLNVFNITINILSGGALWLMAVFSFLLFYGKVSTKLATTLAMCNFGLGSYLVAATVGSFGVEAGMLTLHKFADCMLWIGSGWLVYGFCLLKLVPIGLLRTQIVSVIVAVLIIVSGGSGDAVQLGTMIPFMPFFAVSAYVFFSQAKLVASSGWKRHQILRLLTIGGCLIGGLNDFAVVAGLHNFVTLFPVGAMLAMFAFTLDVDERILNIFRERDYLLENLEKEVQLKTSELQKNANHLSEALSTLQKTQSDLVQSAKMASLGTLSAGIAHEINNSLNHVNGALQPLSRILNKAGDFEGKKKALGLLDVMGSGLRLTFEIMNNLRTYSGLNQARLKEYHLKQLIGSVLSIVKSKIPDGIQVHVDVDDDASIMTNGAALNQVLMNLLVNAMDAMPSAGDIFLSAKKVNDHLILRVRDTGSGMSEEVVSRIFDPFFTTKDVGKGTGLGLHICRSEVEKLGGTISVTSKLGQGSTFEISLPQVFQEIREVA